MSSWRGKRVLVTGADGFLGSNLVKQLIRKGASVITLSRQGVDPLSLLALEELTGQIETQELGSVEDFERLATMIRLNRIEAIYHLAALPLVEIGQGNPVKTFEVNIRGTWNVLEAARQNGVKKVVAVSTSHVYGDNPKLPYKEAFYPQPSRPYETSKACADLLAQCYADSYDLSVEIPRLVNVYGPGDRNFSRIVPKVIRTVLSGKNPTLWESDAIRDFLYVDDAVAALLALGEKRPDAKERNRIYNFGSGKPVKVIALAQKIVELCGEPEIKLILEAAPSDRAQEIEKQYVSIAKAREALGWQPQVSLTDGLTQTIAWYRSHLNRFQ